MVDHIYISDMRAYFYKDYFDLIINASHVKMSGPLITNSQHITTSFGNQDQTPPIINILINESKKKNKILIYSDDDSGFNIYMGYMMQRYQFSKNDMARLLTNSSIPFYLIIKMLKELESMSTESSLE